MENMLASQNINFILVFFEGILSFLSPCVLPLIPIYIAYLAGNGKKKNEDGTIYYERKTVFLNTILFVLGISFTFFLLGMSFTALGSFFKEYKNVFSIIAGIIILLMGLVQLGIIKIPFLEKEHKIKFLKNGKKMTPLLAFVMGFTFSFAWTPCIGPALASVLALASSSTSILVGNALVLLYALGFSIPFLLVGFFTSEVLNFFKEKKKIVQYTIKISGVILIIMGILTLTGMTEKIGSAFGTSIPNQETAQESKENQTSQKTNSTNETNQNSQSKVAPEFTLQDQNGKTHTLSEYKGKVVFINFWATWCPPCKKELPEIQKIYEEYGENSGNVIILGITNPKSDEYPYSQERITKEEVAQFAKQYSITYPVLFDMSGEIFNKYSINSFPTTFMINKDGEVYGYAQGALNQETIKDIIKQTIENKKQ